MSHLRVASGPGVVTLDADGEQLYLSPEQATLVSADVMDAVAGLRDAEIEGVPVVVIVVGEKRIGLPVDVAKGFAVQLASAADAAD